MTTLGLFDSTLWDADCNGSSATTKCLLAESTAGESTSVWTWPTDCKVADAKLCNMYALKKTGSTTVTDGLH